MNRPEVDRIKAAFIQATPEGADISALVLALAEYLAQWRRMAPLQVAKVMAEQAAEIERLQGKPETFLRKR